MLWEPGAGVVVQALEKGQLLARAIAARPNGSTEAVVRIYPVTQGHPAIEVATPAARPLDQQAAGDQQATEPAASDLRLMGHVAGRGDTFVGTNEWIAGPAAPARIEGIAIEWPSRPRDLDIRYTVKTAHDSSLVATLGEPETFIGTRGQALALVGVSFQLEGPASPRFESDGDALFLGASPISALGQKLELTGPTGREPLIGLRLGIRERAMSEPSPPEPEPDRPKRRPIAPVRVFRSGDRKRG